MTDTNRCPCCGSILAGIEWQREQWLVRTKHGFAILNSRRQSEIFDLLWRRRGQSGLTAQNIIAAVYDDANGGVDPGTIRIILHRMRKRLTPIGVLIHAGTAGAGYQIIFMSPEEAAAAFQRPSKHSRIAAQSITVPTKSVIEASAAASVATCLNMIDTPVEEPNHRSNRFRFC